ncbi:hypothetical protein VN97_g4785 [Penicillium thymicola]|uniref:Uncharacterized protein n=1 Tax=Penicillium thymicola TaxID=293382 RepID=A0AAI9X9U0_PENTH|nr:hypothetical protein VN97_g4785 [Penicillium thymicola]
MYFLVSFIWKSYNLPNIYTVYTRHSHYVSLKLEGSGGDASRQVPQVSITWSVLNKSDKPAMLHALPYRHPTATAMS